MIKKLLTLAIVFSAFAGYTKAQKEVISDIEATMTINDVTVGQGQSIGTIISTDLPYDAQIVATQFIVNLPVGFSLGFSNFEYPEIDVTQTNLVMGGTSPNPQRCEDGTNAFKVLNAIAGRDTEGNQIFEHTGKFAYLVITASELVPVGEYEGKIVQNFFWNTDNDYYYCQHGSKDIVYYRIKETSFKINVVDRYVLDENSPVLPNDTTQKIDVTLNRTINANKWSTIVLPFDMDAEAIANAFGENAIVASLDSEDGAEYTTEKNEDGDFTNVDLTFSTVTEMYCGYPYIIQTDKNITSANIDNVTINTGLNDISLGGKAFKILMKGNYKANSSIVSQSYPAFYVISNNKFYKAIESTTINGYRAYFATTKKIVSDENEAKCIRMTIKNSEDATVIDKVTADGSTIGDIYTIDGKLVRKDSTTEGLASGIYIQNGKKIYIK